MVFGARYAVFALEGVVKIGVHGNLSRRVRLAVKSFFTLG